jgi:hypothetical protein
MPAQLLPWPADAIMLICASPDRADRTAMESVNPGQCRNCGADIVYDGRSLRRALEISARSGDRPVKFFCESCADKHDLNQCNRVVDHSGGKSIEAFDSKGAGL